VAHGRYKVLVLHLFNGHEDGITWREDSKKNERKFNPVRAKGNGINREGPNGMNRRE